MKVEEFLNPNSMLTPGIVGSMIMMITNTVTYNFELPSKWVGLALSFMVGLLVVMNVVLPMWQRIIYYALNSLFIFAMAVGTNNIGRNAIAPPAVSSASSGRLQPTLSDAHSGNQIPALALNCSAGATTDAPCGEPQR